MGQPACEPDLDVGRVVLVMCTWELGVGRDAAQAAFDSVKDCAATHVTLV